MHQNFSNAELRAMEWTALLHHCEVKKIELSQHIENHLPNVRVITKKLTDTEVYQVYEARLSYLREALAIAKERARTENHEGYNPNQLELFKAN